MSDSVIQFPCPQCRARLTVPISLAGVRGPCPKCAATIEAPRAEPPAADPPAEPEPVPRMRPGMRKGPLPEPRERHQVPTDLSDRPNIAPKPRDLPEREPARPVSPRRTTEDAPPLKRRERTRDSARHSGPGWRVVVPILAVFVGVVVVYLLLDYFVPKEPDGRVGATAADARTESQPEPEPGRDTAGAADGFVPPAPRERRAETPPSGPEKSVSGGAAAGEFLEEFLGTTSLEERLPLIEPAMSADSLRGGALDGSLPEVVSVTSEPADRNTAEDFVDFPFRVIFHDREAGPDEDDATREITMLVRRRGGGDFKLVAPPFLDLLENRLGEFASAPVPEQRTFFAVIEAIPRCFEPDIPNPEGKFTYKLAASNRGIEIARAYAGKNSPLAEPLYSHGSGISWGRRVRATVTLAWNRDEDPEQPYIEMREIRSLDWNP